MKNLAGNKDCDIYIREELRIAGIEAVNMEPEWSEVPYSIIGRLGDIKFERAWYYWVIKCEIPLNIAEEIYNNPRGREDVRANGHCECIHPSKAERQGSVSSYHIDTQAGLNFFVDTIKKHNLK